MLEVLKQFRVIYGAVNRQFRVVEREHGLSGAQAWLMCELAGAPSLGVTDLAARLSLHQSTVSQLIEKLVRSGYVERATHAVDRRRVRLRLTRRGTTLARRLPRPAEGVLPRALDQLPDAALKSLRVTLTRLIAHMQMRRARDGHSPMG
jgi:DNA-binding MarR family transcriptional regulator